MSLYAKNSGPGLEFQLGNGKGKRDVMERGDHSEVRHADTPFLFFAKGCKAEYPTGCTRIVIGQTFARGFGQRELNINLGNNSSYGKEFGII